MIKKISIIHPSYGRPELALKCFNDWMLKAYSKDSIEYILVLTDLDPDCTKYVHNFKGLPAELVILSLDKGLVKQANYGASKSTGDLLICVSDDFSCPSGWDNLLRTRLATYSDYAVKTDDGIQPFIMTLPMMDRAFYERLGYIYQPEYNHMYADEELAEVAKMLSRYIKVDLKFPHNHYSTGKMVKDSVNAKNDIFYGIDGETFKRRKARNFGL